MKIKAALFDMGKTLIQYDYDSPEEVFLRVSASQGVSRTLQEMKDAFLNAQKEAMDLDLQSSFGKIQCEEYWHKWDSLVLKHLGMADNEELAETVQSKWFDFVGCKPYPEVTEVFSKLKDRGLRLGLISAGYEAEINLILRKADLSQENFCIIVGADTVKETKPSPDVFRYALCKLNVKPDEALFVGDHIDMDYYGAKAVGMRSLLINREGTVTNDKCDVERIRSLREVFRFIN
jgi:putative hydrolase of the HAD superfamily